MKIRKLNKIIRRLALGLAVAAIAAPVAQADPWFEGSGTEGVPHTYGVGATLQDYLEFKGLPPTAQYTYGVGATLQDSLESTVVRPDDRAIRVSPVGSPEGVVRPTDLPCAPNCAEGLLPTAVSPEPELVRPAPADNVRPVSIPETAVRPDDRPGLRGPGAAPQDSPVQIVLEPRGFDWTDAGIGAGFAFGLILLASGMALVARRHRETGTVAF